MAGTGGAGDIRGEQRRVPGLRHEEVAVLAGISTEYYTRSNAATPPASRTASSTASRTRYSSITPNGRTCST
jgi:hypothetical protein